jgi:hypothetical protein
MGFAIAAASHIAVTLKHPAYGRFLGGKWSEHENRKSENQKSIIY